MSIDDGGLRMKKKAPKVMSPVKACVGTEETEQRIPNCMTQVDGWQKASKL
jgi:hypothetical protein